MRALVHVLGLDGPSYWLNFWQGVGSCFVGTALLGTLVEGVRRHSCHVHGCWRPGHFEAFVDGVSYKVCRRHHPAVPDQITADHVAGVV